MGQAPRLTLEQLRTAVAALHAAEERWRALPIGATLTVEWPSRRRMPAPAKPRRTREAPARRSR
ncbi:hypothetical protein Drose_22500 [Dactylosporangium roseum]|uniref:Uncharacterized protein n=1 Tax=Dactylosporangium roseum TaxID=47989 RepID=A0ABY5YX92_9ACTN|nr:hypothetical protein [Dactylosporangium roseum]UWZ34024.1 hypothetical protein Drose_22500 [Dactylosporangium roseum]